MEVGEQTSGPDRAEGVHHTWVAPLVVIMAFALLASLLWCVSKIGGSGFAGVPDAPRAEACNIAVIAIRGDVASYEGEFGAGDDGTVAVHTSADRFVSLVRRAENDPSIAGILVPIDSYGGSASGGERMMRALSRTSLPTVGLIREAGASAAYLAALGADTIIASPFSDVGSIGVTMSYVENWKQNARDGLDYVSLSSGKYKDTGDPNKPISDEERALLARDLAVYHDAFVGLVSEMRKLPREEVAVLADGSSMPGALARDAGLVDTIGDDESARAWFASALAIAPGDVVLCAEEE